MKYSKEIPKIAGYYWVRKEPFLNGIYYLREPVRDGLLVFETETKRIEYADDRFEYAGPIKEPKQ